jgi:hypothetical protein
MDDDDSDIELYPFTSDRVPLNQLINFIARVAYPKLDDKRRRKRIWRRVRYHIKTRKLALPDVIADAPVEARILFDWAVHQDDWSRLAHVPGRPSSGATLEATGPTAGAMITAMARPPYCPALPEDHQELKKIAARLLHDWGCLTRENGELKSENSLLREKLMQCKARDEARREKSRQAGQLGKGVSRRPR